MSSRLNESVACPEPRVPGDLAAFVPEGAGSVLVSASTDPTLCAALRARGVTRIVSLSPDAGSAEGADETFAGDLVAAASEASPRRPDSFTVLISDNALPRYRNPEPYLAAARKLLVPGGLLVLSTPNIQYHRVVRKLAECGWAYESDGPWARKNLRFFTAVELKRLVAANGFEPLRSVPLRSDPPEALPLSAQGYATSGRITLGPLSPSEHQSFLTADLVCLAMRPAW